MRGRVTMRRKKRKIINLDEKSGIKNKSYFHYCGNLNKMKKEF